MKDEVINDAWDIVHLIDALHYADKDYPDGTSTKSEWHKRKAKYIKDYAAQAIQDRDAELLKMLREDLEALKGDPEVDGLIWAINAIETKK